MKSVWAVLYYLWPVRLYHIFQHYLINGTIFEKEMNVKRVFDSLCNFRLKYFSSYHTPDSLYI
jgi:hypothetical protein